MAARAADLCLLLVTAALYVPASEAFIRLPRALDLLRFPRATAFAGSGAFAGPGYTSTSTTNVAPGPGGSGSFNAFAANSGYPGFMGDSTMTSTSTGGGAAAAGFPGFNPFVPQYGQAYPFTPFPAFGAAAPFDFFNVLNNYFAQMQRFHAQAAQQAQQAAASGAFEPESNEVGGTAVASYSPQGGYGSANVFPAPPGAVVTRFGGDEAAQNGLGPVSGVTGTFGPPRGNTFGVFSSSVSGSSNVNGKTTSYKQSTIGVNDNGKVTTYTAHDP